MVAAIYDYWAVAVIGAGLAVKAAHELAMVGLAYLGLGFLMWVMVLLLAMVMR